LRRQQRATFSAANTFILTLGLCESWFDKKSQAYLDVIPPPRAAAAEPDRFEFRYVDYESNLSALQEFCGIIRRHERNEDFQLILTVSPIPIIATFTTSDVVVANSEVEAILRAAA
jgi:hypothetical protein